MIDLTWNRSNIKQTIIKIWRHLHGQFHQLEYYFPIYVGLVITDFQNPINHFSDDKNLKSPEMFIHCSIPKFTYVPVYVLNT